jgi:hypothetical protein
LHRQLVFIRFINLSRMSRMAQLSGARDH